MLQFLMLDIFLLENYLRETERIIFYHKLLDLLLKKMEMCQVREDS